MSKKKVEGCLPSVQITTEDVISFCKKHSQKPSSNDARRWLLDNKQEIERQAAASTEVVARIRWIQRCIRYHAGDQWTPPEMARTRRQHSGRMRPDVD